MGSAAGQRLRAGGPGIGAGGVAGPSRPRGGWSPHTDRTHPGPPPGLAYICEGLKEQRKGLVTLVLWNNQLTHTGMAFLGMTLVSPRVPSPQPSMSACLGSSRSTVPGLSLRGSPPRCASTIA